MSTIDIALIAAGALYAAIFLTYIGWWLAVGWRYDYISEWRDDRRRRKTTPGYHH